MNYSRFITESSRRRMPSLIREATRILASAPPEMVFLGGGFPNPDLFPFKNASFTLQDGSQLHIEPSLMKAALQYGPTPGYPPLVAQLKSLTKQLHNPPNWDNSELLVTVGGQDGLAKAVGMLIQYQDYFITHNPLYSGTIAILNPYDPKYLPVKVDDLGLIPDDLENVLSKWSPSEVRNQTENIPKVIYINPNAMNPCGISMSAERKKRTYEIASRYDLIILEDDPYYFVQFEDNDKLAPSFLSLDVDGRVLRFDSFSKTVSAGLRLGYVTGPKPLIERINLDMQSSILHASSLPQVAISELLKLWGIEKFLEHTNNVKSFYKLKRDAMLDSAEKHLKGICKWNVPTGGMFLWLEVPELSDTSELILKKGIEKNVILIPGRAFMTNSKEQCNFMRASYSMASPEDIDRGFGYLSELIKEEIRNSK